MDISRQYDAFGAQYIERKRKYFSRRTDKPTRYITDNIGNIKGKRVLDIGCGGGGDIQRYEHMGARAAYGIDPSQVMVDEARRTARQPSLIQVGNANRIPLADECIDVAAARFSLHYLKDPSRAYEEIHRVLRPQGKLVAIIPHPLNDLVHQKEPVYGRQEVITVRLFDGTVRISYWTHTFDHWFGKQFKKYFTLEDYTEGDKADEKKSRSRKLKNVPEWIGFVAKKR